MGCSSHVVRASMGWGPVAPAGERAALMEEYLRAVVDWMVFPPAALMCRGVDEWPVGLSRLLADTSTLMRYAIGESTCAVAGPRPALGGSVILVAVQGLWERGASLDFVLRVALPPPSVPTGGSH